MAHAASPPTLLALARDVFGHAPEAWLITVPVEDLGIGEGLSPLAQRGFERAVQEVKFGLRTGWRVNHNSRAC